MDQSCRILKISKSAYYRWAAGTLSPRTAENERIADLVENIHEKHPEMGYRRLKDELDRRHNNRVNDKRMLRICRSRRIKSTIKYSNHGCTRQDKNPYYLADNLLNREFKADKPNQKWLTDVTEFKYNAGIEVKKVYLSAILDLYDRRIVSYVIRDTNDNPLVFDNGDVISGGNFHAEPVAFAADILALALAEIGAISERRMALLLDTGLSRLPAFLMTLRVQWHGYKSPRPSSSSKAAA